MLVFTLLDMLSTSSLVYTTMFLNYKIALGHMQCGDGSFA